MHDDIFKKKIFEMYGMSTCDEPFFAKYFYGYLLERI